MEQTGLFPVPILAATDPEYLQGKGHIQAITTWNVGAWTFIIGLKTCSSVSSSTYLSASEVMREDNDTCRFCWPFTSSVIILHIEVPCVRMFTANCLKSGSHWVSGAMVVWLVGSQRAARAIDKHKKQIDLNQLAGIVCWRLKRASGFANVKKVFW